VDRHRRIIRRSSIVVGAATVALVATVLASSAGTTSAATPPALVKHVPTVLYVGTYKGIATPASRTYPSIQAAVDAAAKGDTILVAPGDYHETGDMGANAPSPSDLSSGWYGGVDISTPDITLRGMDRDTTIVDGTLASAATPCSAKPADQNLLGGAGRNGILVWKANNVHVDNLTVCNFLSGSGNSGNEVWWNGGAGSGVIGLWGYEGSFLTATSTYFANSDPSLASACSSCALYGIFSSDSSDGYLSQLYANNFSDSGLYIGACHRVCNATVDGAWMEDNALGYSGTNSGGALTIENSTFDNNKEGVDTNTQLEGDPPPPQDGRCLAHKVNPVTGTHSCWVFRDNTVAYNNNPNVPVTGSAGLGPTGTGMTISGGRWDTVLDNTFVGNGAWGILFAPYPSGTASSDGKTCAGTGGFVSAPPIPSAVQCLYDAYGNALVGNKFSGNGTFGNPTNADFGNLVIGGGQPKNCFGGNTEWNSTFTTVTGLATSANANASLTPANCGGRTPSTGLLGSNTDIPLLVQAECDAGVLAGCASGYPQATAVTMQPVPSGLPTMANPCSGVPANVWCPGGVPAAGRTAG
jgi:hypothetical protein